MRVEPTQEWADQAARRRWPWLVGACATVSLGVGALWLISLWSFFDAGGTLGGFGEAADARLDDAQYERNMSRRAWIAAMVAGAIPLAYAVWRAWIAPTSRDRGRALVWVGAIIVLIVLASATPSLVARYA